MYMTMRNLMCIHACLFFRLRGMYDRRCIIYVHTPTYLCLCAKTGASARTCVRSQARSTRTISPGNLETSKAFAEMGGSAAGWSRVGLGLSRSFGVELDHMMDQVRIRDGKPAQKGFEDQDQAQDSVSSFDRMC